MADPRLLESRETADDTVIPAVRHVVNGYAVRRVGRRGVRTRMARFGSAAHAQIESVVAYRITVRGFPYDSLPLCELFTPV